MAVVGPDQGNLAAAAAEGTDLAKKTQIKRKRKERSPQLSSKDSSKVLINSSLCG
jgi:hypothetical protein